jgi:hypothetical protein
MLVAWHGCRREQQQQQQQQQHQHQQQQQQQQQQQHQQQQQRCSQSKTFQKTSAGARGTQFLGSNLKSVLKLDSKNPIMRKFTVSIPAAGPPISVSQIHISVSNNLSIFVVPE